MAEQRLMVVVGAYRVLYKEQIVRSVAGAIYGKRISDGQVK